MSNELKLIPVSTNALKIKYKTLILEIRSSGNYISIESNGKIDHPEELIEGFFSKTSAKFEIPREKTKSKKVLLNV